MPPVVNMTLMTETATPFWDNKGVVAGVFTVVGIVIAALIIAVIILMRRLRHARIAVLKAAIPSSTIKDRESLIQGRGDARVISDGGASTDLSQSYVNDISTVGNKHSNPVPQHEPTGDGGNIRSGPVKKGGTSPPDEEYSESIYGQRSSVLSWSVSSELSETVLGEIREFPVDIETEEDPSTEAELKDASPPHLSLPSLDYNPNPYLANRDSMKSQYTDYEISGYFSQNNRMSTMTGYADTIRSASPVHESHDLSRNQTMKSMRSFRSAYDPYYRGLSNAPSVPPSAWTPRSGERPKETNTERAEGDQESQKV